MRKYGVKTAEGWYVKSLPSGEPAPLEEGLWPEFQAAGVTTISDAF